METDVRARNNVRVFGRGAQPMLFAHGFGCDQNMWRWMTPAFENDYKIVLFDYVGSGKSDVNAYDRDRYATLDGYAQDIVDIVRELDLRDVILVAHSVSSMISVLAAIAEPDRFSRADPHRPFAELPERRRRVPRRLRARGHRGTPRTDGQELHRMGELPDSDDHEERRAGPSSPEELQRELLLDRPRDSAPFAEVDFFSDNRADLPESPFRPSSSSARMTAIAPDGVGQFVADAVLQADAPAADGRRPLPAHEPPGGDDRGDS